MIHNTSWTIEREREPAFDVCIQYTYRAGSPAHYGSASYPGHPAEPPEIEIVKAWRDDDRPSARIDFEFTEHERERIETWILENPPEESEPDPDELRDLRNEP